MGGFLLLYKHEKTRRKRKKKYKTPDLPLWQKK